MSSIEKDQRWLNNRIPLIGGWLRRRAARGLAEKDSPRAIGILAEAVARSRDGRVVEIALVKLEGITGPRSIDATCGVWAETRHPAPRRMMKSEPTITPTWISISPAATGAGAAAWPEAAIRERLVPRR